MLKLLCKVNTSEFCVIQYRKCRHFKKECSLGNCPMPCRYLFSFEIELFEWMQKKTWCYQQHHAKMIGAIMELFYPCNFNHIGGQMLCNRSTAGIYHNIACLYVTSFF